MKKRRVPLGTGSGGRPEGYVVSESTKEIQMMANPNRTEVITPYGTYPSYGEAARQTGIDSGLIKYYCLKGGEQRNGNYVINRLTGEPNKDYTQWVGVRKGANVRSVLTPKGPFRSVKSAADAYGVSSSAMVRYLKVEPGFSYTDKEQDD